VTDFEKGRTDAFTQEGLANRQQAISEIGMPRQAVMNQIQALLGMKSADAQDQRLVNTPNVNVAAPDYAGMAYRTWEGQMQMAKEKQAQKNAAMGGAFGLGGSVISALPKLFALSDRNAKEDIQKVGKLDNGLPVYRYRYKDGGPMQIGLMAQDVEKKRPKAVAKPGLFKMVDYELATED
jgi:hypothetical protein